MVFALVRVLRSFANQFKDLVTFLDTVLDREPLLLHDLDGLSDQYSRWRISSRTHKVAFETLIEEVSNLKMLEIRRDDDLDWVYAQDYLHCQLWRQSTCLPLTDLYRDSMGQSHDDVPLEIDIRPAFEVSTTTRITKEDVTPSHIVAVSSSGEQGCLSPPLGLRADQYTLIRLSKVEDRRYWRRLIQK